MSSPHSPQDLLLLLPLQTSRNRNTFQAKEVVLWVISVPLLLTTTTAKTRSVTTSITIPIDTTITLALLLSGPKLATSTTSLSEKESIINCLQFWFHPCKIVSTSFSVVIAVNGYRIIGISSCLNSRFLPLVVIAVYFLKVLLQRPNSPTTLHSVSFKRLNTILPTKVSFNWWTLLIYNPSAASSSAASALKHTNPARTTPSSSLPQLILCNLKSLVCNSRSTTASIYSLGTQAKRYQRIFV